MIYFDNNATTRLAPAVLEAMLPFLTEQYGNPSSVYDLGMESRKAVAAAREQVAGLLGASDPSEIVFTSGGTESDNWAIRGALLSDPAKRHIITTRVEHEAIRKLCENLQKNGYEVTWIDVDGDGMLDLDELKSSLRPDTAVVSVMLANNETGILFPVNEIAEIVKSGSKALFHVDGVNAAGKIAVGLRETAIDLFSVSAHKFHGPKGVGALYVRSGVDLPSFAIGGGQETGRRAGTEAVHQIAGLGKAAELAFSHLPMDEVRRLRDKFEDAILSEVTNAKLNGTADRSKRLPNTSNISFTGMNGEVILAMLSRAGVCVSTGSACNAEMQKMSPVLEAMNIPFTDAMGAIRFSLGRYNTEEEVNLVLNTIKVITSSLGCIHPK
jgi:cysteine desulfurase